MLAYCKVTSCSSYPTPVNTYRLIPEKHSLKISIHCSMLTCMTEGKSVHIYQSPKTSDQLTCAFISVFVALHLLFSLPSVLILSVASGQLYGSSHRQFFHSTAKLFSTENSRECKTSLVQSHFDFHKFRNIRWTHCKAKEIWHTVTTQPLPSSISLSEDIFCSEARVEKSDCREISCVEKDWDHIYLRCKS